MSPESPVPLPQRRVHERGHDGSFRPCPVTPRIAVRAVDRGAAVDAARAVDCGAAVDAGIAEQPARPTEAATSAPGSPGPTRSTSPVSYTHLTLPTIYSV